MTASKKSSKKLTKKSSMNTTKKISKEENEQLAETERTEINQENQENIQTKSASGLLTGQINKAPTSPTHLSDSMIANPPPNSSAANPLPNSSAANPLPNSSVANPLPNSSVANPLPNSSVANPLPNSSVANPLPNSSVANPPSSSPANASRKKTSKKKSQKTLFEGEEVPLDHLFEQNLVVKEGTWISNCFLQFNSIKPFYPSEYAQKPTKAYFYFNVMKIHGQTIESIDLKKRYLPLEKLKTQSPFYLGPTGIGKLMRAIQTAKVGGFPKITILAEEKSVTFRKNKDTHYYLGMLIGDPNSPLPVSKNTDQVAACANCDVMLLRFGFDWVLQRDDLRQSHCPYCKAPLKIKYRTGKIIKLDLNLSETGCIVDSGNNQLGVIYHGHAIKTTIWAHGLLYFLENYQNFFPNKAMGPLKIKLNMANPSEVLDIEPQTLLNIEWRPIELFPEDFMAF